MYADKCGQRKRMVSLLLSQVYPAAARVSWLTTTVPHRSDEPGVGHAYLFRGNGTFFTPGFGRLCDQLRTEGLGAEDLTCHGLRWAYDHITSRRSCQPLVLIGHSCGGRRCLQLASQLEHARRTVDLLIGIDVALPPRVPGNVQRAVHLFRSRWRLYPARLLQLAPGSSTLLENIDLDRPGAPCPGRWLHHLNITAAKPLHHWMVQQVLHLVQARRSQE